MLAALWLAVVSAALGRCGVLQSDGNTLAGICDNIVTSLEILNRGEVAKLVDRERCRNYELLGERILKMSNLADRYCYRGVQFLFCNLKYQPYEANFNCEHIKDKFIKIVRTCAAPDAGAGDRNCSSINAENQTIFDPLEFCRTNYVTLGGRPRARAGERTQFDPVEHDYCAKIVETFNLCQYFSRRLGLRNYCLGGGFQSYCTHYVTGRRGKRAEVRDAAYEALCKNFVLPFVFARLIEAPEALGPSVCTRADENISRSLLRSRVGCRPPQDRLMFKSKSLGDAFESEFAYKKWVQDLESRLDAMVGAAHAQAVDVRDLVNQSGLCFHYLNYPHRFFYAYDHVVVGAADAQLGEFLKSKELVDRIYARFLELSALPREIVPLIAHIGSVIALDDAVKEALIHFRDLYALVGAAHAQISSGAHYYFSFRRDPTLARNIPVMESSLRAVSSRLPGSVAHIKQLVNAGRPFEADLGRAGALHERATYFKNIAVLLEAQLKALYKMASRSRDSNFVKSLNLS